MTFYTDIYPDIVKLTGRTWFKASGTATTVAPAGSRIIRVSAIGAGGYHTGSVGVLGGGAAFARSTRPCTPGESFNIQVGNVLNTAGNGTELGDSWVKRASDSSVIVYADRGRTGAGLTQKGLAVNCIGDVTRDGFIASSGINGASGSDANDRYGFGIGGRGGYVEGSIYVGVGYNTGQAPLYGGGGCYYYPVESGNYGQSLAGGGVVVIEFYDADPGYGL